MFVFSCVCLNDPGWWSQRAVTPSVLRAVAAVEHTLPSGLYDNNRADPCPHPPPVVVLSLQQQDGHPQVQQKHSSLNVKGLVILLDGASDYKARNLCLLINWLWITNHKTLCTAVGAGLQGSSQHTERRVERQVGELRESEKSNITWLAL